MRQFDKPSRPSAPHLGELGRFNDPVTLVCVALALAVIVLSLRIVSLL